MQELETKIVKEAKADSLVVACRFLFPGDFFLQLVPNISFICIRFFSLTKMKVVNLFIFDSVENGHAIKKKFAVF